MRLYSLKYMPVIDPDRCTGCRECITVCHPGVLQMDGTLVAVCNPDRCDSDGGCVERCPDNAINMHWIEMAGNEKTGRWQRIYV